MLIKFRNFLRFQLDLPPKTGLAEEFHLDLGCGANPHNPFCAPRMIGTDFEIFNRTSTNQVQFIAADLTRTLPFDSNSFTSVSAYDVLEHIPRWERMPNGEIIFPFVNLMNEIHRVLRPGGQFLGLTPGFPSPAAFQDPTHVNFITRETLNYFSSHEPHASGLGYGFKGNFEVVYEGWMRSDIPLGSISLRESRNITSIHGLVSWLKLLRRLHRALRNRKPTHILWILRKKSGE